MKPVQDPVPMIGGQSSADNWRSNVDSAESWRAAYWNKLEDFRRETLRTSELLARIAAIRRRIENVRNDEDPVRILLDLLELTNVR